MHIQTAIQHLIDGANLTQHEMRQVMQQIMTGEATAAQIGGFLVALRMQGETVEEITAATEVMRELSARVPFQNPHLVDIVGTGGDSLKTFNISTCSSFVVAAAGAVVAKHGNRSVSSSTGSADLLEAAGVNINLNHQQVQNCVEQIGVGFMFAPMHHQAMKYAIGPRKEMKVRTIFNLLGPLTNPAGAQNQLIGVFDAKWLVPFAQVLQTLKSNHIMVVHADDGLDEISIATTTQVCELNQGQIREYTISPEDFGFKTQALDSLIVENAEQSLSITHAVLNNEASAARDIVSLNAGAAIYCANLSDSLVAGIERAKQVLADGTAKLKLQQLIQLSNNL